MCNRLIIVYLFEVIKTILYFIFKNNFFYYLATVDCVSFLRYTILTNFENTAFTNFN